MKKKIPRFEISIPNRDMLGGNGDKFHAKNLDDAIRIAKIRYQLKPNEDFEVKQANERVEK